MATIAAMPRIVDVDFLEQFHYSMDKAGEAAVTEMKSLLIDCRHVSSETEEITKCMDRALYYFNKFQDPPWCSERHEADVPGERDQQRQWKTS